MWRSSFCGEGSIVSVDNNPVVGGHICRSLLLINGGIISTKPLFKRVASSGLEKLTYPIA